MSFPSALRRLEAGDSPEAALRYAFKHDTQRGFKAISAVADLARQAATCCPGCKMKDVLGDQAADYLRCEPLGDGVAVDFDPLSETGLQIARLLGTDAARPLIEKMVDMDLGFANCCKVIASTNKADTLVTPLQQIKWQASIDC
jgi:hypothetical protein